MRKKLSAEEAARRRRERYRERQRLRRAMYARHRGENPLSRWDETHMPLVPGRAERIARYAERAALGLPLFDAGDRSRDAWQAAGRRP